MGREEEMGILIELVSVRAGASSKAWRTTEPPRRPAHMCRSRLEAPGAQEHPP